METNQSTIENEDLEAAGVSTQRSATVPLSPETTKAKDTHFFSVTIGKPPQMVFDFWRDFKNLPSFMKDLAEVQVMTNRKSRWKLKFKSGLSAEWDAEIVDEIPGEMISWRSLEGSQVETSGIVRFEKAAADRGTIVRLQLNYHVPGGKLTELAGKFTGEDPYNLTLTNLRRLKAFLETGEIPTTEGQSSGRDEDLAEAPLLH
jgi:uncharacterized membrane protein